MTVTIAALRRAVCAAWQCLICGNWTDASACPNCTSYRETTT